MPTLKLTKNELRSQQVRLSQLERYLPTLKLKKSMLQVEVAQAYADAMQEQSRLKIAVDACKRLHGLLQSHPTIDWEATAHIHSLQTRSENIAGVEVQYLEGIEFAEMKRDVSNSPLWSKGAEEMLRDRARCEQAAKIAQERADALNKELREVSIRVNLFEKILIPRSKETIKKVKIFLQDQELAAVGRAKVAKSKHACLVMTPLEESDEN